MAGSRGESWWQPPKQFEEYSVPDDVGDEHPPDAPAERVVDTKPRAVVEAEPRDPDEVDLEDHGTSAMGWTSPTGDVIAPDPGNRRFYVGVALILIATAIGVVVALSLGSSDGDGGDSTEPAVTTVPSEVRGATTIRPGVLSPTCAAEQQRLQDAEDTYQKGSVNGQYTDMTGLVNSGKLAAASTLFVITNEVAGTPPVASWAGFTADEYQDYLVLPIPDGPCDTT
jgi:hypothetical protein